jgi:signal-transduction protein with cAMP-binding, CBS, and nucleotidyltransferase domain
MKKVIRLTESDLTRLVKRVVNESSKNENTSKMDELKEYLKELKDEGVIHNDVSNHIIYLVKKIIKKEN